MKQLKLKFLKECESNIELQRSSLASAFTTPTQSEILQDHFCARHSIQGGGGFCDLDRVVWLAETKEDVHARFASGSLPPPAYILRALRCAEMVLTNLLDAAALGVELVQDYEKSTGYELQNLAMREQNYRFDVLVVREIRTWSGATVVPNSPDYIRGVINLWGTIVPVVDLRMRFGLGQTEKIEGHGVIIGAVDTAQIGLIVDSVCDAITILTKDIADIPQIDREKQNPFFLGLITGQESLTPPISLKEVLFYHPSDFQSTATEAA